MERASYRIAYVIGELDRGGAAYQLHELLRHLDRGRFQPRVFTLASGGWWAGKIRALSVPVDEIPPTGSADVGRLTRLRAGLRGFAPHVLHTVLRPGNSYGRLAALGLGIPVVVSAERNVTRCRRWRVLLERALERATDAHLVNCEAIAAWLVEHERLVREKIRIIPDGVDLKGLSAFSLERKAARAAAGLDPARRLVAHVGRLEPRKDLPTFLRAAAAIAAALPDVDFLVVGEGTERAQLEDLGARLRLDRRLRFLGLRHDVPALLAAVDVLALTSRFEGLPNVLLEAMGSGAVVVATDVGGCRELVVNGENGLLVPSEAPAAVAAGALRVLRDSGLARRLATAARRRVESTFGVELMARRTADAYLTLLRGKLAVPAIAAA